MSSLFRKRSSFTYDTKLWSSGMRRPVVWWMVTNVSVLIAASIFRTLKFVRVIVKSRTVRELRQAENKKPIDRV